MSVISSWPLRTVAFPASLTVELAAHLAEYAEPGRRGRVFVGPRGGVLRRNDFRRIWLRAIGAAGLGDVHFHDLRHTGNTLAATGGASTRELMHRMGHSSVRAALIYQHLVNGRDHEIAGHVDDQIRRVKGPGRRWSIWHVSGTAALTPDKRSRPRLPDSYRMTWAFAMRWGWWAWTVSNRRHLPCKFEPGAVRTARRRLHGRSLVGLRLPWSVVVPLR
jgi:hypothetical protein